MSSSALSPGGGVSFAYSPVGLRRSIPLTHWINFWLEVPLVCMLWCPFVCWIEVGSWGCATSSCRLAREPGGSSRHPHLGKRETNATHQVSLVLDGSLSSWRPLLVPQSSLCSLFLLLVAEAVQWAHSCLSPGIALNISVHSMDSWESVSSLPTYAAILGLPLIPIC